MKPSCQMVVALLVLIVINVLSTGVIACEPGPQLDQGLLNKFKSEAPLAWRQGKERFERFFDRNNGWEIDTWKKTFSSAGEKVMAVSRRRIGTSYGLSKGTTPTSPGKPTTEQSAWLYNPQYVAELRRSDENQHWVLGKLTRVPSDSESPALAIAEILKQQYPMAVSLSNIEKSAIHFFGRCPIGSQGYSVGNWFELDGLQFQSIEELNEAGSTLVKVKLRFQDKVYTGNAFEVRDMFCTAVFDSTNNWCLTHVEGELQYINRDQFQRARSTIDYEYEVTNGIQYIKSSRLRVVSLPDEKLIEGEDFDSDVRVTRLSPFDFSLESFGLIEPDWYIPPRPWWLYASLTGMVLLLVGAVLLRYGKQLWKRN